MKKDTYHWLQSSIIVVLDSTHLVVQSQHHVCEARKLEQHEEDHLTGQVLPQQLVVAILVDLWPLHGQHDEIGEFLLQHEASLLHLHKVVFQVFTLREYLQI